MGLGLATWFVLLMILEELTTRDARARRDLRTGAPSAMD
jgi:hypothetical protein